LTAPAPSDEQLIARCRKGDARSFEGLVGRHQERVFNTVYRMVGSYEEACDLTQEAFLNAYRGLARFRGGAKFSTWMYRIALNAAYSHLRRQAARPKTVTLQTTGGDENDPRGEPPAREDGPAVMAENREEARLMSEALMRLGAQERELVVLRDLQGRDYEEMAEILGCPLGTIKSRLHRARSALRDLVLPKIAPETRDAARGE